MSRLLRMLLAALVVAVALAARRRRRGRHQGGDHAARHQGLAGAGQERAGRVARPSPSPAARRRDPAGQSGVTSLMATLLTDGAGPLASQAFRQRQEDAAASLGFSASLDRLGGTLRVLSANREEGFELLRLALTQPRFDADMIEQRRAQIDRRAQPGRPASRHRSPRAP